MNKLDFLDALKDRLAGLPGNDLDERLEFYAEMIDDRVEDGLGEEEAVSGIGDIDEIADQILGEYPLAKIVKEKVRPKRRLAAWEIILILLGSPLWISLLGCLLSVALTFAGVFLLVIVSFWCADVGLAGAFAAGLAAAVVFAVRGNALTAIFCVGCAFVCGGLSIPVFFLCRAVTKGIWLLLKKAVLKIKSRFVGKENK